MKCHELEYIITFSYYMKLCTLQIHKSFLTVASPTNTRACIQWAVCIEADAIVFASIEKFNYKVRRKGAVDRTNKCAVME